MPYILGMCVFFVAVSLGTSRLPDATVWPLRIFTLTCLGVASYSAKFILGHGSLYVSSPTSFIPLFFELANARVGQLAKAQHPTMGRGGVRRCPHQGAQGPRRWSFPWKGPHRYRLPRGGQEETRVVQKCHHLSLTSIDSIFNRSLAKPPQIRSLYITSAHCSQVPSTCVTTLKPLSEPPSKQLPEPFSW
jgi:hypothetical protein